ncbi:MAG: GerMN domain-containing protein [Desulfosarcinaceae bacterium]
MRRRPLVIGLAGVAAVVVLTLIWAMVQRTLVEPPPLKEAPTESVAGAADKADAEGATDAGAVTKGAASFKEAIHLYFVATDGRHLMAEARTVMRSADPVAFGRQITLALLEGPRTTAGRSLPEEAGLRAFYLGEDGTAYVDLDESVSRRHPGGVTLERLSVYSLVNSLVLNCDAIKAVRILIEGSEAQTLAGHIDLQRVFNANMLVIK